jgi:hypothetical protein
MPGARSVVSRNPPPRVFEPKTKRTGSITKVEQALVSQFVLDQPREVTEKQVTALSRVLRRSKDAVKGMVAAAREDFNASADFYVNAHKTSVSRALAVTNKEGEHDPKALDVAARASQWAMENLSAEGQRIVDAPTAGKGNLGPRIVVAVRVGGLNDKPTADITEIPSSVEGESTP